MSHSRLDNGPVETQKFRPFEDVSGIEHAKEFITIIIPGSG